MLIRVQRQLRIIRQLHFLQNTGTMRGNGFGTDLVLFRDIDRACARSQLDEYLVLAVGQQLVRRFVAVAIGMVELPRQQFTDDRADVFATGYSLPDGFADFLFFRVLGRTGIPGRC
jgi:hypothetical protein